MNRKAIKYMIMCENESNCPQGNNCAFLHSTDYELENDEQDEKKTEHVRLSKGRIYKQKIKAKHSLERVNINHYQLSLEEIPQDEMTKINVRQADTEYYVSYQALLDSGSTISAVTPRVAQKWNSALNIKATKGRNFIVENGGQEDETFSGDYIKAQILIPNTRNYHTIHFYIMPHNE